MNIHDTSVSVISGDNYSQQIARDPGVNWSWWLAKLIQGDRPPFWIEARAKQNTVFKCFRVMFGTRADAPDVWWTVTRRNPLLTPCLKIVPGTLVLVLPDRRTTKYVTAANSYYLLQFTARESYCLVDHRFLFTWLVLEKASLHLMRFPLKVTQVFSAARCPLSDDLSLQQNKY